MEMDSLTKLVSLQEKVFPFFKTCFNEIPIEYRTQFMLLSGCIEKIFTPFQYKCFTILTKDIDLEFIKVFPVIGPEISLSTCIFKGSIYEAVSFYNFKDILVDILDFYCFAEMRSYE